MGIIERLTTLWFVSAGIIIAGAAIWRLYGPPTFHIDPDWWNINYPIPRTSYVASNFGTYELVSIEKKDVGSEQWVPFTATPQRANVWGYMEYITEPNPDPTGRQLGTIEFRAVGLETGKMAYSKVTVSNEFR
jgi:hypothetical protein